MTIRVIAGSAKGKRLKLVPGDSTRPIMDRVKESLFNIIGRDVIDSTFLDLFAGTGSVAIEALSRGAASAMLLDIDAKAIRTIQENLQQTKLESRAVVRKQDAFALLRSSPEHAFDFVYIAPPQYHAVWRSALQQLDANSKWVAEDGQIIVQIDPTEREQVALQRFEPFDERRYGNTLLWFFQHRNLEAGLATSDVITPAYLQQLEGVVAELINEFGITAPPIPVERMLQEQHKQLWNAIDITQISTGFLKVTSPYSPRMSLARFVARMVAASEWGQVRGLYPFSDHSPVFQAFARIILMPGVMMREIGVEARTPELMSEHFQVPEEDAQRRLDDLQVYSP